MSLCKLLDTIGDLPNLANFSINWHTNFAARCNFMEFNRPSSRVARPITQHGSSIVLFLALRRYGSFFYYNLRSSDMIENLKTYIRDQF